MGNNNLKKTEDKIYQNNKYNSDVQNIHFLSLITADSYCECNSDFKFNLFTSINNIIFLIYANKENSIIFYNINNFQKINEIKNAHSRAIIGFRHYLDKINKKEYIISISDMANNIKLWNLYNFENLMNLQFINKLGWLPSACFLKDLNQNYILSCNCGFNKICEPIKLFDFNGNKIKEIKNSGVQTFFIDNYYDYKSSINYIITGNINCSISYNYNENEIYHKYKINSNKEIHSIRIYDDEEKTKLIESGGDGFVRIWDFHLGKLITKINCNNFLNCICLWDTEYAFVGCDNKLIKLVNLKNGIIIKNLVAHHNYVLDIKKIIHPRLGKCLISQGYKDDQIRLWVVSNDFY